jgi:dihydroneopterin aldolase
LMPGQTGSSGLGDRWSIRLKSSMDKIFIHALKAEAIIGIYDEIGADIRKAALTDSIEDTLNYKRVAKRVLAFIEASEFQLVETLAEHLAMLILEEFGVPWVRIHLSKPGAVRSSRDVGVEVERDRIALASWLDARARSVPVSPHR